MLLCCLAIYLVTWTGSYVFIFVSRGDGFDFSHYFEYPVLAWTFQAGELPAFIWLFSVAAFLPLPLLVFFLLRRQAREGRALGGHSSDA